MIKAQLTAGRNKKELLSISENGHNPILVTSSYQAVFGNFKTATNAGVQTQTVIEAKGDGAIFLTDLIISTDKTNNSITTVRFYDGTYTENICIFDSSNAPVNLAIPFNGHWQSWAGANFQLLTDTIGQSATIAVGYYHIKWQDALRYAEWNAKR